jgi:hypothetical protein
MRTCTVSGSKSHAGKAIRESWIRYFHFGLGLMVETSQNVPPAISESPRGIRLRGRFGSQTQRTISMAVCQ